MNERWFQVSSAGESGHGPVSWPVPKKELESPNLPPPPAPPPIKRPHTDGNRNEEYPVSEAEDCVKELPAPYLERPPVAVREPGLR